MRLLWEFEAGLLLGAQIWRYWLDLDVHAAQGVIDACDTLGLFFCCGFLGLVQPQGVSPGVAVHARLRSRSPVGVGA